MEIVNRLFDNKEFTLVDNYFFNNDNIYHFTNEDDDIFCYFINNDYQKITDESIIEALKQEYYLFPPEFLFKLELPIQLARLAGIKPLGEITGEEKSRFIDEQVDQLTDILDKKTLLDRLKTVKLFSADWNSPNSAMYHPSTNTIFMRKEDFSSTNRNIKAICLHETIHALSRYQKFSYELS
ncbi:MAG: hypothetical protein K6D97_01345 [Clostridia bacterium]|nr:hypothetical protein [Clostridia bacterium]